MTVDERVTLIVTLSARAGRAGRLRAELASLAAVSRADEGCLRYDVLEEEESADRFVLVEEWTDDASLVAHNARPHVLRFREASSALTAGPMQVQRLRRAG